MLYLFADHDGAPETKRAAVAGEIIMINVRSTLGFALIALASVFATGCIAESNEPEQLVWYDDDLNACFTANEKGQSVEVPCDESAAVGMSELNLGGGAGCSGSACCQTRDVETGFCL
jgi:hypothetical protein